MNPEILLAIVAVGDAIRANPRTWSQIEQAERDTLQEGLMPDGSFVPLQREYLSKWWLRISESQLSEVNDLCPADTNLTSRLHSDGFNYVCADLLSDALEGGRLKNLLPILSSLTLIYILPEEWPVIESEE